MRVRESELRQPLFQLRIRLIFHTNTTNHECHDLIKIEPDLGLGLISWLSKRKGKAANDKRARHDSPNSFALVLFGLIYDVSSKKKKISLWRRTTRTGARVVSKFVQVMHGCIRSYVYMHHSVKRYIHIYIAVSTIDDSCRKSAPSI